MIEQQGYDVVVVGAGAAGLGGAVTLARARRSVLVVDAGEPRNAPAAAVHGYPSRDGAAPGDLLGAGSAEVEHYGGTIRPGRVVRVTRNEAAPGEPGFALLLDGGDTVWARRVLLAVGLRDELPDVNGLRARWGRDVLHCPYCHGYEIRDRTIGVLATGPMAVHMALVMGQWSSTVTLLRHHGHPLDASERVQLLARGVEVVDGEVSGLEVVDDALRGVRLVDGRVVDCGALVVTPRYLAREDLAIGLGAEVAEHPAGIGRHVVTDPATMKAAPGVWAAGNVTNLMAQVVQAAAQGVQAGIAINADLVTEEVGVAVAAAGPDPTSPQSVAVASPTEGAGRDR